MSSMQLFMPGRGPHPLVYGYIASYLHLCGVSEANNPGNKIYLGQKERKRRATRTGKESTNDASEDTADQSVRTKPKPPRSKCPFPTPPASKSYRSNWLCRDEQPTGHFETVLSDDEKTTNIEQLKLSCFDKFSSDQSKKLVSNFFSPPRRNMKILPETLSLMFDLVTRLSHIFI